MNPQYGYGHYSDPRPHLVDPANPDRLLCGSQCWKQDYTRSGPPEQVDGLHDLCLTSWLELPAPVECPVCGGNVPVDGGRVARHGVWVVRAAGLEETGVPCLGGGAAVGGAR